MLHLLTPVSLLFNPALLSLESPKKWLLTPKLDCAEPYQDLGRLPLLLLEIIFEECPVPEIVWPTRESRTKG